MESAVRVRTLAAAVLLTLLPFANVREAHASVSLSFQAVAAARLTTSLLRWTEAVQAIYKEPFCGIRSPKANKDSNLDAQTGARTQDDKPGGSLFSDSMQSPFELLPKLPGGFLGGFENRSDQSEKASDETDAAEELLKKRTDEEASEYAYEIASPFGRLLFPPFSKEGQNVRLWGFGDGTQHWTLPLTPEKVRFLFFTGTTMLAGSPSTIPDALRDLLIKEGRVHPLFVFRTSVPSSVTENPFWPAILERVRHSTGSVRFYEDSSRKDVLEMLVYPLRVTLP